MTGLSFNKHQARTIAGILFSIITLAALILYVDAGKVLSALREVRLIRLIPVLIMLIISLLSRAISWRYTLQKRITLWKSFLFVNAGYFANTVLPFRLGEFTRAFLLLPSGFSFWEGFPTIVLERMFDVLFTVGLFLTGLSFALGFSHSMIYAYILASVVLVGLILLVLVIRYQDPFISWLENIPIPWLNFKEWLIEKIRFMISGLNILKEPYRVLLVFIGIGLSWATSLIYQFILLRVFIPEAQFGWIIFVLGVLGLGISIPSSPGNIGIFEASITLALSAFGVDQSRAFGFALTSHIIHIVMTTLFGAYALVREGIDLGEIWRLGLARKKEVE
jgi:uncharacterized protein (TIRG00374 family)